MPAVSTVELQDLLRRDRSVAGLLAGRVAEHPDRPAVRWQGTDISYAELDARANASAHALLDRGVGAGDRVAAMMVNSPDWLALWLGACKIGAVTVAINTAYKGAGLSYLLGHSAARVLAIDADLEERVRPLAGEIELPEVAVGPGSGLFGSSPEAPPAVELDPGAPCSILYTSGTTGPPKGCLLPHGQYLAAARLHSLGCGYGPETVVYCCMPLFHIAAQNYSFLSALAAGGTFALDPRFSASRFWERIAATGATAFNFVGAMAMALWSREPSAGDRAHGAEMAFGAPMPPAIWAEWEQRFGVRVLQAYGMTENALPAILAFEDAPVPERLVGVAGRVSATSEMAVVDEHDEPVAPGTVGEILTRPKIPETMMLEYVDDPEATGEAFRGGWFHTGDLGRLDEDGFLFYVDRKRDALRRRGEMVSSWELETLIGRYEGVEGCVVIGVASELTEDDVMVVVACADGAVDPAALIAYCELNTARFQVPRYVRLLRELPMTETQRVEKYRLRQEGVTSDTWDALAPTGA